jgi:hypothetical protein
MIRSENIVIPRRALELYGDGDRGRNRCILIDGGGFS